MGSNQFGVLNFMSPLETIPSLVFSFKVGLYVAVLSVVHLSSFLYVYSSTSTLYYFRRVMSYFCLYLEKHCKENYLQKCNV